VLFTLKYAGVVDFIEGNILLQQLVVVLEFAHLLGRVSRASLSDVRDRGAQLFTFLENGWKRFLLKGLVFFFLLFVLLFEICYNIDAALAFSSITINDFLYKVSMEYVLRVHH
jgi:hypothetical protein